MNVIRTLEEIIKIRDEITDISKSLEYRGRELDKKVHDLIEFLKAKRIIETRTVK